MHPDADVSIACGGASLRFQPGLGGRAISWQVDGIELLAHHGDDPVEHGMYVMAPWAGRIRDNAIMGKPQPVNYAPWAIHGTVLDHPAAVTHQDATSVTFVSPATPWSGTVTAAWSLDDDGSLTTAIEVETHGDAFPATIGWHPWFRRVIDGSSVEIDLPATHRLVRGEDQLPTGARAPHTAAPGTFDDAFVVPARQVEVHWPGLLSLQCVATEPWFVVFDRLPDAVCVEPQSGPPDGLRELGDWTPQWVEPGSPLSLGARWSRR